MLGLGMLLLFMVTIFNNASALTLGFSDLLKLVRVSGKDGPGFIHIVDSASGQLQRISNLSNVVVGHSNVIARVDREFMKANSGTDKGIEVRVDRQPEEQLLAKLLDESRIDWRYAAQPNPLYNYLPLLLMTGLLVMMFLFMIRRMGGRYGP
jgi:hypothetical protein